MGLALLLSVGRSLRVAKDLPHRYRAARRGTLPKFEPEGRPQEREQRMKTEMKSEAGKNPEPSLAATQRRTGPDGVTGTPDAGRVGGARSPQPWRRIVSWFTPQRWGLGAAAPVKRFGGKSAELVQQELALENVRPCRNDLKDADWELAQPPQGGARLAFLRNLAGSKTSGSGAARAEVRGAELGRS
jgi:hypothetical protein